MQELTIEQKFEASLAHGNYALAELYLTDFFHRTEDSLRYGGDCFRKMEKKFGLIATAETALRIYDKISESARWSIRKRVATGFFKEHSTVLFQEMTGGLARKVAHVLLQESRSTLGAPTLDPDQLCTPWTPQHIEANPTEAARTAILVDSASLFRQALEACAKKDGIVAAVALIKEGLPNRLPLYTPPSLLLPAMTGFLKGHITGYTAATSGKTALDQILFLDRHVVAGSPSEQDLTVATQALMRDISSENVLDLVQPALNGNRGNTLKAPTSLGKTLSSLQEQAWTDHATDLRNNGTKAGKVLLQLADCIRRMTAYSKIRPQAVRDYLAVLQDMPDPNLAVNLAARHLGATDKKEIFRTNESIAIAAAASNLLPACDLTNRPQHWLPTLNTLFYLQREAAAVPALSSGLTATLNALAQKDPLSALQEASRLGVQACAYRHDSVDRAAAAVVETVASSLAKQDGPARALEMLLASYSPDYGLGRRPAVEYALSRSIKTLEQQVFPPALQPPVAA